MQLLILKRSHVYFGLKLFFTLYIRHKILFHRPSIIFYFKSFFPVICHGVILLLEKDFHWTTLWYLFMPFVKILHISHMSVYFVWLRKHLKVQWSIPRLFHCFQSHIKYRKNQENSCMVSCGPWTAWLWSPKTQLSVAQRQQSLVFMMILSDLKDLIVCYIANNVMVGIIVSIRV